MTRARDDDALGLFSFADFEIVRGRDALRTAGRAAAWYFADETVAVPRSGLEVSRAASGVRPFHDVRRFGESHPAAVPDEWPPLVWIAAPDDVRDARLSSDASLVSIGGRQHRLTLSPKLALNRSWFDASSAAWFADRALTLRGTAHDDSFEARVLWPASYRLGPTPQSPVTLPLAASPGEALRAMLRASAAAHAPFEAVTLWRKSPAADWSGKPVLAFVLNGAQGDDDESHAGHFAIATGRIAPDGSIGDWLVNSFYSLDIESEKGIIAAPVPLMNYLGDVNAGQSWYRPSWLLVAVMDDASAVRRVQSGLSRVFLQFWRHQLSYYHPTDNCTSMSMDALRALGLDVPLLGPTSRVGAWVAFPWLVARERSIAKARLTFDYLVSERTRLLPALAIEAIFTTLMQLAERKATATGTLGGEIARSLEGIAWLRIPQFPSSRAWGGLPVVTLSEYRDRLPTDPSKHKIVQVPPRPFAEALRDDDLLPRLPHPSDLAVRAWSLAALGVVAVAAAVRSRGAG